MLFFNTIHMMGETPEEWKSSIVVHTYLYARKVVNGGWKIIVQLMCFIKYITVVNEKLKAQAKQFFWFARLESEKADTVLMHHLL
jgi:hypothetical protein